MIKTRIRQTLALFLAFSLLLSLSNVSLLRASAAGEEAEPETTTAAETTPAETKPDAPPTGEGNETVRWGIIGGSALAAGILLIVFRRVFTKKDPEDPDEE